MKIRCMCIYYVEISLICNFHPSRTRNYATTIISKLNNFAEVLAVRVHVDVVNVNVNVISRTALIRNRVSRRVLHVSKITWGVLYLFQEAQTLWLPVLGL